MHRAGIAHPARHHHRLHRPAEAEGDRDLRSARWACLEAPRKSMQPFPFGPKRAGSANRPAGRVALASVALVALFSIPVFSTVLPPLFDYPNHLARFSLLLTGG